MTTEINYEQKIRQQEMERKASALEAKNRALFQAALDKHLLVDNEANYKMMVAWSPVLSTDAIEFLLNPKTCPPNFQPLMTTREGLVAELIEILRDPTEHRMSAHDLHTRQRQLENSPLSALRKLRRELTFKAEVKTAEQARAYLRAQRQLNKPKYPGYENMPAMITLPGESIARTAKDALLYLVKKDFWTFKNRYVPRYGMAQITDILNRD